MSQTGDDRGPATAAFEPEPDAPAAPTAAPRAASGAPTAATGGEGGIGALLASVQFRRLWLGQIFSQLADKFYIVLMVFLIAQYWVTIKIGRYH
jgi:hypothetical protein